MSTQARIYIVQSANGDQTLVKATTQAQALRHVARNAFTVRAAAAIEVADMMANGKQFEDATKESDPTTEDKE